MIPSLHQNGIREIYVVVGYRKELFASLEAECLGVKQIEDPYYDRCNDIASLYCAWERLENAIILDGGGRQETAPPFGDRIRRETGPPDLLR